MPIIQGQPGYVEKEQTNLKTTTSPDQQKHINFIYWFLCLQRLFRILVFAVHLCKLLGNRPHGIIFRKYSNTKYRTFSVSLPHKTRNRADRNCNPVDFDFLSWWRAMAPFCSYEVFRNPWKSSFMLFCHTTNI